MKNEKFHITGMTCAACQANITRNVGKLDGVEEVNVSLLANQMTVAYDEEKTDEQAIIHAAHPAPERKPKRTADSGKNGRAGEK